MLAIQAAAAADPTILFSIDLAQASLTAGDPNAGQSWNLELAAGPQLMLVSGQWDGTGQLLARDSELTATAARLPYLSGFRI
jgi:3-isopropylmalate/(R)-2-methylmalate dehydratase small subunit